MDAVARSRPLYAMKETKCSLSRLCNLHDLKYIASGKNNDVFSLKFADATVVIKVGFFEGITLQQLAKQMPDEKEVARILKSDPLNAGYAFSLYTNSLVARRLCPHFVIAYTRDCIKGFYKQVHHHLPPEVKETREHRCDINDVTMLERFDIDMLSALMEHRLTPGDIYAIVFQVLYAIMVLQAGLACARHNDLHCGNVFLKAMHPVLRANVTQQPVYVRYEWDSLTWTWRVFRHFAAIGDFDFADLGSGECRNIKVSSNQFAESYAINCDQNQSYDAYTFLYSIWSNVEKYVYMFKPRCGNWKQLQTFLSRPFCAVKSSELPSRPHIQLPAFVPRALLVRLYPQRKPDLSNILYTFGTRVPNSQMLPVLSMTDARSLETHVLMEILRSHGIACGTLSRNAMLGLLH